MTRKEGSESDLQRSTEKSRASDDVESHEDGESQKCEEEPKKKLSLHKIYVLVGLSYMNFWGAACISLQAPFFPQEAEAKGATPTQYGFIFGVFELVVMLVSPLYGKIMPIVTPRLLLTIGILIEGVSCAVFGLLDKLPSGAPFIGMAFFVRIVEGFGSGALMTSSFTIIASEFPQSIATTFSLLETAFGVGLIVGPTVGGALYQAGGYMLPFVVCGACLVLGSVLYLLLPRVEKMDSLPPRDLKAFLFDWGTITSALAIVTSILVIGYNVATLEPHLRKFDLKPVILGTIFTITGGIYAITSPIWGRVCDKGANPFVLTGVGALFVCIGLVFIGPFPFMPFKAELWIVITSLVVIGFGLSAKLVSSFVGALQRTLARGFPENLGTFGMVSALFASSCSTGAFIGPSIGGVLLDSVGYEMGTVVLFAVEVAFMLMVIAFLIVNRRQSTSEDGERAPLLRRLSRRDTMDLSSSTICPRPIH